MRATMVCMLVALTGCASSSNTAEVDPDAPGLRVGESVTDVTLYDAEGDAIALSSMYADEPLVLVFYRGNWCPFCTRSLKDWAAFVEDIKDAGANFVAVTPESPDEYAKTVSRNNLDYTVLGDPNLDAARAFNVYYEVDDEQRANLESFGIDVSARNSSGEWELPAPGTFIIDTQGVVRYAYANWDYTDRADPDQVVEALAKMR